MEMHSTESFSVNLRKISALQVAIIIIIIIVTKVANFYRVLAMYLRCSKTLLNPHINPMSYMFYLYLLHTHVALTL